MHAEFSYTDLDEQFVELLPERETLFFNRNWAAVYASNTATAVNAGNWGFSGAHANAYQSVYVSQH